MASKPLSADSLDDSEATLRLVDDVVTELQGVNHQLAAHMTSLVPDLRPGAVPDLARLPEVLLGAYDEIVSVLERLQKSRGILERVAMDRLQRTHEKLVEVSNATEMAATDMLDGLDRALGLVDRLDDENLAPEQRVATRGAIRDELHQLISCLQFQDITSQQLGYASSVLRDLEDRLHTIVNMFGEQLRTAAGVPAGVPVGTGAVTFDPAASIQNAEGRQALADEIFFTGGRA